MTSTTRGVRRILAAVVTTAAALGLAVAGPSGAQAGTTDRSAAHAKNTVLTVKIRACEGCEVTLVSYLQEDPQSGWSSEPHTIAGGQAAFVVPTAKTLGLTAMIRTPWEGQTGYVTMAVFRYQGLVPGDRIGFNRARTMTKASGCWAGTSARQATLRIKVRRVMVPGVHGKVPGQIAWAPTTQVWLRPTLPVYGGVLGAQDVILCKGGSAGGRDS